MLAQYPIWESRNRLFKDKMDSLSMARRHRVNKNTDHTAKKKSFLPLEGFRKLTSDRFRMNKFIEFMFQILRKATPTSLASFGPLKMKPKLLHFEGQKTEQPSWFLALLGGSRLF